MSRSWIRPKSGRWAGWGVELGHVGNRRDPFDIHVITPSGDRHSVIDLVAMLDGGAPADDENDQSVTEPQLPQEHDLWSVNDLADYLRVRDRTIYAWNNKGTGPKPIKIGKHVRYRRTEVEDWLASRSK